MTGASMQCSRTFCSTFRVPTALTSKSVNGSRTAQSCDGCAAVWITTAMSRPYRLKICASAVPVADVGVVVGVRPAQVAGEPQHVPGGGRLGAEELPAHVVVDADHVQAEPGEVPDRLGTDQTA